MGHYYLIIDTETTVDTRQRLTFGIFRYCYLDHAGLSTLAEGILYADDLPDTDPDGYATLHEYARSHAPDVDLTVHRREPNQYVEFLSRDEFANRWLWRVGYQQEATIVGFNLPFDLSRIAVDVGDARQQYYGGFSLGLWRTADGRINTYRPRLRMKLLDSKKAFLAFTATSQPGETYRGQFLDCRTLAFALTSRAHSLASACQAFDVAHPKTDTDEHGSITPSYIDYARRDVLATSELCRALVHELEQHGLDLAATHAYSPASLAKSYYRQMGIPRPLDRDQLSAELLGYTMASFYGARSECRIRRQAMPVTVVDFTSMYPTVHGLMGTWSLLTCAEVQPREVTSAVRTLLEAITVAGCFDPNTWSRFMGIAKIRPNADVVPVRSRYGGDAWTIGVNYLTDPDRDYWYAVPDLVASTLLTGTAPEIVEAIRFEPVGTHLGLNPAMLRGTVPIDPNRDDFFTQVIEERARYTGTPTGDFLKVLANAGCYGIFAELNRRERHRDTAYSYSDRPLGRRTDPETPGAYTYPPIATCITAAARLMLALLERCVTDRGGTWVFTDTDSMAICAAPNHDTANGVLSSADVDAIRARFNALNPYRNISNILKEEYRGWCYAISAKRYALYHRDTNGSVVLDKNSQHGLGHLLNPSESASARTDWMGELWRYILERDLDNWDAPPAWIDRPAITRYTVSQPALLHSFAAWNTGRSYADSIKPTNFVLIAHAHPVQPARTSPITPIAPYEPDGTRWEAMTWVNRHDPQERFTIATFPEGAMIHPDHVYVQSYRDIVEHYRRHPEAKFNQRDGATCTPNYRGTLHRKHVRASGTRYLGKESRDRDAVQHGLVSADDVTRTRPADSWEHTWAQVSPILQHLSATDLADALQCPPSTARHILTGRRPTPDTEQRLLRYAAVLAAADLGADPHPTVNDPHALFAKWNDTMRSQHVWTIQESHDDTLES